MLNRRGGNFNAKPHVVANKSREGEVIDEIKRLEVTFALVVTREKLDTIHDHLKHFEAKSGIITQQLWVKTLENIVRKNQVVTLENVVMKTNEKCAGTNMKIATSNEFVQVG